METFPIRLDMTVMVKWRHNTEGVDSKNKLR
jgi:hypothetical protein